MRNNSIKDVWINFRTTKEVKQQFQQYCRNKETTMSKQLYDYVIGLVGDGNE